MYYVAKVFVYKKNRKFLFKHNVKVFRNSPFVNNKVLTILKENSNFSLIDKYSFWGFD